MEEDRGSSRDPRGPYRTIATIRLRPDVALVTFEECEHTARFNRIYHYEEGETHRCLQCGPHGARCEVRR